MHRRALGKEVSRCRGMSGRHKKALLVAGSHQGFLPVTSYSKENSEKLTWAHRRRERGNHYLEGNGHTGFMHLAQWLAQVRSKGLTPS